ncbi:MAG: hypothetical protein HUU25_01615 [Candidatus Sumerlaeia bacterium]|nr:hypothetical protein [Candidatus Sumerlaeia bacterium]
MFRTVMIIACVCAALFMAVPWLIKSSSDADVAERNAQVAVLEQEIMTGLRAGDHPRVQRARDQLFALFPGSDREPTDIYEHCLRVFNMQRSQPQR